MPHKNTISLFLLSGTIFAIVGIYSSYQVVEKIYGQERLKNALFVNYNEKNYPDFHTEQGAIATEYLNTCYNKIMNTTLSDFYICSAFRPYQVAGHSFDICSEKGIQLAIEKGARFHYIDLWSSNPHNPFDSSAYPVVRNKTLMPKYGKALLFDNVCSTFASHSWTDTNYPLLLYLNLQHTVQENKFVQKKIADILWNYFKGRFPSSKYSFSTHNIGEMTMKEAMGKVIIITNTYPNDAYLQEMTNGVINEQVQNSGLLMEFGTAHKFYGGTKAKTSDMDSIVSRNKIYLGMVIPEEKLALTNIIEPGSDTYQIPFKDPQQFGFQAVFINFQKPGKERDDYIQFFKKRSFVLKPDSLRNIPCPTPSVIKQNKKSSYAPRTMDIHQGYFTHNF